MRRVAACQWQSEPCLYEIVRAGDWESPTTRSAGGLDFTAKGGKIQRHVVP
jgi:hypothetical protein